MRSRSCAARSRRRRRRRRRRLACALTLRAQDLRVEAWHRDAPADTASAFAAAIWYSFRAEPRERVLAWSAATCERLARFAAQAPDSGVERVPPADVPRPHAAAIRARVPVCSVPVHLPWLRAVRAGLRPCRPTVRLERNERPGGRAIVHCHGHGGSVYTLSWGCAVDVARLFAG